MLTSVLSAIKRELTRFETFDRDLFVISPEDMSLNTAGATHLKDVCDPLGANLVLAASGYARSHALSTLAASSGSRN